MSWASEIRPYVSRIEALVDRNRHRCVVDVPEIRIASFVGRPGLLAVSGKKCDLWAQVEHELGITEILGLASRDFHLR